MLNKYKITVFKLDSKGKEKIIDVEVFNTRQEAEQFISNYQAMPKPYKWENKKLTHYVMEGV